MNYLTHRNDNDNNNNNNNNNYDNNNDTTITTTTTTTPTTATITTTTTTTTTTSTTTTAIFDTSESTEVNNVASIKAQSTINNKSATESERARATLRNKQTTLDWFKAGSQRPTRHRSEPRNKRQLCEHSSTSPSNVDKK